MADRKVVMLLLLLSVLSCVTGSHGQLSVATRKADIAKMKAAAKRLGRYKQILSLLERRGPISYNDVLLQVLATNHLTIFLPTDTAWKKLSPAVKRKLSSGKTKPLIDLLELLTITSNLPAARLAAIKAGSTFLSLKGSLLEKRSNPKQITIGLPGKAQARIYGAVGDKNVITTGRVSVHGFDTWLIPPGW